MKLATMVPTALHGRVLCLPIALALTAAPAFAQEVDHAAMGHAPPPTEEVDHAAMGHHETPPTGEVDHAAMGHGMPEHHGHVMDTGLPTNASPINPIPSITQADREAAFPDVAGHQVHDNSAHSFWLLDRLETWDADTGTGAGWEAMAWVGTDIDRLWLRSEGERVDGTTESADIEVLYGRAIAPWWDLVAGVRHDFGEGPSKTFAAIGVQGLSPYMFEVGATAYVGESGQTAARLEVEYETLFTNRLILQSMAEAELHGKDDERRGIGSGLGTVEVGLRLRYEVTRQFAPYIGVVHERAYGKTADLRRAVGEDPDDSRIVAGVRLWF
ncbi:copper resistance protein B [Lysobacter sp. F6437]|uniref:copper resistance protein B n=1 Tax=Lysobacter sp. F6437 TaxID=3459296 RepID=UPI00403DD18D